MVTLPRARTVLLLATLAAATGAAAAGCKAKDRTGARLELADARLVVDEADGTRHVLSLAAGGQVAFDGEPVVKLETNGHILIDGKPLARLEKDGGVSARTVRTNAIIRDDAAFLLDGTVELTLGEDGVATGPLLATMDHPRLHLDGATVRYEGPPGARRAVMLGFAAFVTGLPATAAN